MKNLYFLSLKMVVLLLLTSTLFSNKSYACVDPDTSVIVIVKYDYTQYHAMCHFGQYGIEVEQLKVDE